MTKFNKILAGMGFIGALGGMIGNAQAGPLLDEGFDTFLPTGWTQTNNSSPLGTTGWFQGNTGVFSAQAGPANSYAAANFLNAAAGGDISNWLLTPEVALGDGEALTFYTRGTGAGFADRLEVRLSTNGASGNVGGTATSVGDFTTLLLTVNETLAPDGYPADWTQFSVILSGIGASVQGRIAFRYSVPDTSTNADYIGLDTLILAQRVPIPEPPTLLVVMLGLTVLGWQLRRGMSAG